MARKKLYERMLEARRRGEKLFALLIDPDKTVKGALAATVELAGRAEVDFLFVGGSLLVNDRLDEALSTIRKLSDLPIILFPGSTYQINNRADAILFLSLISGRNPELLIGQHVLAAPYLKASPLEVISTGYLLIDGGTPTTVSYMSSTLPIPADKEEIAASTALAGELLGLRLLYLDAGSGARTPVSLPMIEAVRQTVAAPLVVGGGIRTPERAAASAAAGADVIVVGNALEKDPTLLPEMVEAVHAAGQSNAEHQKINRAG